MLSGLDGFAQFIKVQDIFHGVGIAKEKANMGIGDKLVRMLWSSW
jgi:hypothetical protein